MRSRFHRLLSLFIIMIMVVISLAKELPVQQAQASVTSEGLAHTYLNVICKYLDLGKTGKDKFNFNINKKALQEGAKYVWYIKEDKGNPKAVTIDSKTGIVTAKSVGTAYIRCKITLVNKKVLRPEAKVIVRNNITQVKISNIPDYGTLKTGTTMDFDQNILNTVAGKDIKSSGITRWEIAKDTAGVGNATEDGVVIPKNAGEFSIRAVCFQSIKDYNLWLVNKEANMDCITAASVWVTITVIATVGEAATQEQLNDLLVEKNISQITISTTAKQDIKIPEGDYSDKTLVVNAPNTNISNYGVFKLILIKSASNSTWDENAVNNSLVINDSDINLLVSEKSRVKSVIFGKDNGTDPVLSQNINEAQILSFASDSDITLVNLSKVTVTGKIDELYVTAATKLILFGSGSIEHVTIEDTSKGTQVATSVMVELVSNADFIITLLKGSDGTTINIPTNTTATIENISLSSVGIHYRTGYILLSISQAIFIPSSGFYKLLGEVNTSSVIKLTPIAVSSISGSAINIGQKLYNSALSGTFMYNFTKVDGYLSWVSPETVVNSTGYFIWTFTPADTTQYTLVNGTARVFVLEEIMPVFNAAKTAIESADYTDLYVYDLSDSILKLLAVRKVTDKVKGITTVDVIWNSQTSNYDVTISYNGLTTTISINATFVNHN